MADGVQKYAVASLTMFFPDNDVSCRRCRAYNKDRKYCQATGEPIIDDRFCGLECKLNVIAVDATNNNFEDV